MKATSFLLIICMLFVTAFVAAQNVGIGTLSPTTKLQIAGVNSTALFSANTGPNTTGISISSPSTAVAAINFNLAWQSGYRLLGAGYGANLNFSPSSGLLSYATTQTKGNSGDLMFFNTSNLYIDSNGYVGLGTSVPKTRLHALSAVIGSSAITPATGFILSVGGKIICEELKVQLNGSWPDYVFGDHYTLLPLDDLEKKVMTEKHLPGMLSAAEVNEQMGIEMADMQKRMLEKMEELYRYVFEVNKENQRLKERVAMLENKR